MQRNTFRIIIAHLIAIIFGKVLWSIPRISKYYKFGPKYSCWWFLLLFQQTVNSNLLSITSKPTNTNVLHEIFISDRLLSISAEHVAFWCGNRPIKYAVFFLYLAFSHLFHFIQTLIGMCVYLCVCWFTRLSRNNGRVDCRSYYCNNRWNCGKS